MLPGQPGKASYNLSLMLKDVDVLDVKGRHGDTLLGPWRTRGLCGSPLLEMLIWFAILKGTCKLLQSRAVHPHLLSPEN